VGQACESARGPAGGASVWVGGEHRARHRSAVSGTLECGAAEASATVGGGEQEFLGAVNSGYDQPPAPGIPLSDDPIALRFR
jgi:hypothetical protein